MKAGNMTESELIESTDLSCLHYDLRRILRVQFKEFIHHIEDTELGIGLSPDAEVATYSAIRGCGRSVA